MVGCVTFISGAEPELARDPKPRKKGTRSHPKKTRTVARIQRIVATRMSTPISVFRFVKPNEFIHAQNGFHRSRNRKPE